MADVRYTTGLEQPARVHTGGLASEMTVRQFAVIEMAKALVSRNVPWDGQALALLAIQYADDILAAERDSRQTKGDS
jgi:hypothetical protein